MVINVLYVGLSYVFDSEMEGDRVVQKRCMLAWPLLLTQSKYLEWIIYQKKASHELWSLNLTQISPATVTLVVTFRSHGQVLVTWLTQELKPLWREDQLFEGNLRQARAETLAMVSSLMPALQMFARDLMCFIPYWDKDPQYVSNARTYNNKKQRRHWNQMISYDLV